jgi:hypothetical protein
MNLLELFAGSRSIGNAAEKYGLNVFSVDWTDYENIDLIIDIGELEKKDIPFIPDVIWSSPDCTSYSIAACSTHRNADKSPKSEYAKKCDMVNQHWIGLIKEWSVVNPNLVFFIENPRGMLRHMEWMQGFKRHTVWYCLARETKVITKEGTFEIKDLEGNSPELLMRDGSWKKAPIQSYGLQELMKITLKRSGAEHVIHATPNHKWIVRMTSGREVILNTKDLKRKDRIPQVRAKQEFDGIDEEGIRKGFVYGDGWNNYLTSGKPYDSVAQFCGTKDEEMIKYFDGLGRSRRYNKGHLNIAGLPFGWKKDIPNTSEHTPNHIAGWLAGYLAADGTVGKNGQVVLSSAKGEDLEKVRQLCQTIGIGTYFTNEINRVGFGKKRKLYTLNFVRSTLPIYMILLSHHKDNFSVPDTEGGWTVHSVESTNRYEKVFCAEVEGYETFVLDGGILTHNCQYGDDRAKPTDIWTNSEKWLPKPMCRNFKYDKKTGEIIDRHCHHESARRGAKTGTQGRKDSYNRSKIPMELCEEIVKSCK